MRGPAAHVRLILGDDDPNRRGFGMLIRRHDIDLIAAPDVLEPIACGPFAGDAPVGGSAP